MAFSAKCLDITKRATSVPFFEHACENNKENLTKLLSSFFIAKTFFHFEMMKLIIFSLKTENIFKPINEFDLI